MITKVQLLKTNYSNIKKNNLHDNCNTSNPITNSYLLDSYQYQSHCPYFASPKINKNIAFFGNYNPLINYKSTKSAILNPDYNPLNIPDSTNISLNKYTSNTISELLKNDREFLSRGFSGEVDNFSRFGKIGYIQYIYNNLQKDSADEISKYFKHNNLRPIEKKYLEFYNDNLQSLEKVAKCEQKYSILFLDKKIGNQNLVDFWFDELGVEELPKNKEEKINLLNNKINESFQKNGTLNLLALKTIDYYLTNEINEESVIKKQKDEIIPSSLETIEVLKNKLTKMANGSSSEQKEEFIDCIKNDRIMNTKINDELFENILLSPLKDDGIDVTDVNKNIKKEYLLEIAEDNHLRKESIEKALSTIRKGWISAKAEDGKLKNADDAIKNENLVNFNHTLVKKIFTQNNDEDSSNIIKDIKLFEKEATKAFMSMIPQEPFKTPNSTNIEVKENINVVLSLVAERLNTTKSESEAQEIYDNIDDLAETLFENDFEKANKAWDNLTKISLTEWKEKHLPRIIQNQQQGYIDVKNFIKSPIAKEVATLNILNTFFNSETVTIEEKAFLVKKMQPEIMHKQGYDLCKFLSDHVPSNPARQRIINNLIESEGISNENFDFLKSEFIGAIRHKNSTHHVLDKKIQKESVIDLFLQQTPFVDSLYKMSNAEKLAALNKYPTEELNILAQDIKEKYLMEKSKEAFEEESAKYDLAPRLDRVMKNLEMNINGKTYSILEIINSQNGQLTKLIETSNDLTNAKLKAVMAHLTENTKEAREMHVKLGIILDKIQTNNPQYAAQIRQIRSFKQKLRDGLISPTSGMALITGIIAAAKVGGAAGAAGGTAVAPGPGTVAGGGAGAIIGALSYPLMLIASSLIQSFSRD